MPTGPEKQDRGGRCLLVGSPLCLIKTQWEAGEAHGLRVLENLVRFPAHTRMLLSSRDPVSSSGLCGQQTRTEHTDLLYALMPQNKINKPQKKFNNNKTLCGSVRA